MRTRRRTTRCWSSEPLEVRNLLAANVTAIVKNDVLQVEGTDNADAIYLREGRRCDRKGYG